MPKRRNAKPDDHALHARAQDALGALLNAGLAARTRTYGVICHPDTTLRGSTLTAEDADHTLRRLLERHLQTAGRAYDTEYRPEETERPHLVQISPEPQDGAPALPGATCDAELPGLALYAACCQLRLIPATEPAPADPQEDRE